MEPRRLTFSLLLYSMVPVITAIIMLWLSFVAGAVIGGCISLIVSGSQMIATAALACVMLSAVTQIHTRRHRVRHRGHSKE